MPADTKNPVGYRLSSVAFDSASGEPVAPSDSQTALSDILSTPDLTQCPAACVRPVGLAVDSTGRVFMSSDSTGEIYVLVKSSATPTSSASGTIVTATGSPNGAPSGQWYAKISALLGAGLAAVAAVMLLAA